MIRVLLCDSHGLFRQALHLVLARTENIQIIGEAASAPEALKLLNQLVPDILLLETSARSAFGLPAERWTRDYPNTQVIVYSACDDSLEILRILKRGARGYFLTYRFLNDLIPAIHSVYAGNPFLGEGVAELLAN
jgi:DNA-binding NarL/FixJ family response regulator